MDTIRELARVDPWRESLERSLARRRKPPRRQIERGEPQAVAKFGVGKLAHDAEPAHQIPSYWRLCWRAICKRWIILVASGGALLTLALLAATRPSVSDGRGAESATAGHAHVSRGVVGWPSAGSGDAARGSTGAGVNGTATCPLANSSSTYVNPLAGAAVVAKRIDQGVDYAGSGMLTAIGAASVTSIAMSDTGWPGAFIEYRLLVGPDDGCFVYYAEGVSPADGLYAGETVRAGQPIATIVPDNASGIEVGWGAGDGTKSYAAETGDWDATHETDNIPTAAGENFSALIASLGGPPGKVEAHFP